MTNTHILHHETDFTQLLLIDCPYGSYDSLRSKHFLFCDDNNIEKLSIMLTHGHYDHIGDLVKFKEYYGELCDVYVNEKDLYLIEKEFGDEFDCSNGCKMLKDGDGIEILDNVFGIMEIPGHTQGSVGIYQENENRCFVGDTLFYDSVGRTDLAEGDWDQLHDSIKNVLYNLPDETIIYPGHGPQTTIERESKQNYFVRR